MKNDRDNDINVLDDNESNVVSITPESQLNKTILHNSPYLKKANLRDGESIADDERLESVVIHFEKSFRVENFFRVHVDLTQALLRQLFLVVEFRLKGWRKGKS